MTHDPSKTVTCEWRERFEALVASRMQTPFAWGSHDCCTWGADAVETQTGVDLGEGQRGTYSDAAGAARVLASLGGIESLAARAGDPIPVLHATVGDIGLLPTEGRDLIGVCAGQHWLTVAKNGLTARKLSDARLAWRVARG